MSPPSIVVNDLTRIYRIRREKRFFRGIFHPDYEEVRAVDGATFTIAPGEAVAFLGPNGAGKTTTLKVLTGLMHPTSGTVRVLGYTPFDRSRDFLRRIGLVMGNKAGLNWDLTARQSFELFRSIYRISPADYSSRLAELTEALDVGRLLDRQVRRLSLGERMKLELIGAVLHAPDVLFLDEPTIGLDIVSKRSLRAFLRDWQRRTGFTMVLTSHDMTDVEEICNRVIIINHGRTIHDGSLSGLLKQYRQTRYIRVLRDREAEELVVPPHAEIVLESEGEGVVVRVPDTQFVSALGMLAQQKGTLDLHVEQVPLESIIADVFEKR